MSCELAGREGRQQHAHAERERAHAMGRHAPLLDGGGDGFFSYLIHREVNWQQKASQCLSQLQTRLDPISHGFLRRLATFKITAAHLTRGDKLTNHRDLVSLLLHRCGIWPLSTSASGSRAEQHRFPPPSHRYNSVF